MSFRGIPMSVLQRAMFFFGVCTLLTGTLRGEPGKYLGPIDVVASPDQKVLYVVESDAQRIDVLDVGIQPGGAKHCLSWRTNGPGRASRRQQAVRDLWRVERNRVRDRSQHWQRAEHDCRRTQPVCSRAAPGRKAPVCVQSVQQ